jgi:excisionase family DNA binding protein
VVGRGTVGGVGVGPATALRGPLLRLRQRRRGVPRRVGEVRTAFAPVGALRKCLILERGVAPVSEAAPLALELPPVLVEAVAQRAAEIVAEQNGGFLDVRGAAQFLGGCSTKRIYNLVERGELPHHRAGGRLLFDPQELREWVDRSP